MNDNTQPPSSAIKNSRNAEMLGSSDKNAFATTQPGQQDAPYAQDGLGVWNYYFLLKLVLFWRGSMGFHPLENLAFAAFLLLPFSGKAGKISKIVLSVILGVALFYYDTWLPSISRLFSQVDVIKGFSLGYFAELGKRYVSIELISIVFLLWVGYRYIDRWLRTSVLIFITLAVLSWRALFPDIGVSNQPNLTADSTNLDGTSGGFSTAASGSLDAAVTQFFNTEKLRKVAFPQQLDSAVPFDILLLHICSLSWDDMAFTGLNQHPVLAELDIVFNQYNSAASYSGPAAIRLMRASCGQSKHADLYEPAAPECNLFDNLRQLGFATQLAMNHDGNFDNFLDLVIQEGHFTQPPLSMANVQVAQYAFDGSPIHSDLQSLNRWLNLRSQSTEPNTITYYNSISLHDGNRLAGSQQNLDSLENFHPRMTTFLTELSVFFEALKASKRRVMVLLVPEHGAGARGDAMQAAAFREIPSPQITRVPVGIKFFGPEYNDSKHEPIAVNRPVSHLALSHVIAKAVADAPFSNGFKIESLITELPETKFVAENEGIIVAKKGAEYFVKFENAEWIKYPAK